MINKFFKRLVNWILDGLSPKHRPIPSDYEGPEGANAEMDTNYVYPDGAQLASFHHEYVQDGAVSVTGEKQDDS